MTALQDLARLHNAMKLPRLELVRVLLRHADLPADLAGKTGWARLAGRVVWTAAEPSVPAGEVIAAEWVEGATGFRLLFGPEGRRVIAVAEVADGGEEMLRETVRVKARGFGGAPPAPQLVYHVYWGLDAAGVIDRRFDAFMGFAGEG